ncbi:hypothetical protein BV898_05696 [Hypsibius exemplaris]|uniref:Uncharacterized protein n=1 Tax=Hypsibius exemplaris TaxID=2072580 RepID=A0A1W0WYX2_HYPEX|nr:hypothetical protein BV898_05696 [Hypsibius exemplaris]
MHFGYDRWIDNRLLDYGSGFLKLGEIEGVSAVDLCGQEDSSVSTEFIPRVQILILFPPSGEFSSDFDRGLSRDNSGLLNFGAVSKHQGREERALSSELFDFSSSSFTIFFERLELGLIGLVQQRIAET